MEHLNEERMAALAHLRDQTLRAPEHLLEAIGAFDVLAWAIKTIEEQYNEILDLRAEVIHLKALLAVEYALAVRGEVKGEVDSE